MGKRSDTYLHQTVKFLQYNGNHLNKTSKGTKQKEISVDLKVNEPVIGNSIDKVYVFTDKTYFKQRYSL